MDWWCFLFNFLTSNAKWPEILKLKDLAVLDIEFEYYTDFKFILLIHKIIFVSLENKMLSMSWLCINERLYPTSNNDF
jgi:hypothetical protein